MNRLPRRSARIRPPARGRLAATPSLGQSQSPMIIVRQRPAISGRTKIVNEPGRDELHSDWISFYIRWSSLFKGLNRLWKWSVVLITLIILSILFGMQL